MEHVGWETQGRSSIFHFGVTKMKYFIYVVFVMHFCFTAHSVSFYRSQSSPMKLSLYFFEVFFIPSLTRALKRYVTRVYHHMQWTLADVSGLTQPCFHRVLHRSSFSQLPDDAVREQQMGKS